MEKKTFICQFPILNRKTRKYFKCNCQILEQKKKFHLFYHIKDHIQISNNCFFPSCLNKNIQKKELGLHLCKHFNINHIFQCKLLNCLEEFFDEKLYKLHLNQHKELLCEKKYCKKVLCNKNSLKCHKKIEQNKPFQCDICLFSTHNKTSFKNHNRYNHGPIKIFPCYYCVNNGVKNIELQGESTWLSHIREHHKDKLNFEYEKCVLFDSLKHDPKSINWLQNITLRRNTCIQYLQEQGIHGIKNTMIKTRRHKKYAIVDYLYYSSNAYFLIQIDAFQHKGVDVCDEFNRMEQVSKSILQKKLLLPLTKSIVWIRFNPDNFIRNHKKYSWNSPLINKRVNKLIQVLHNFKPKCNLNVLYMFYDSFDGKLPALTDCDSKLTECVHVVV